MEEIKTSENGFIVVDESGNVIKRFDKDELLYRLLEEKNNK